MPRDGAATKERILDAAERLVIANGYAATSLDEVIAESRSSKGAFFHHFRSKLDLAQALVARYAAADVENLSVAVAEALAASADPVERILHVLRAFEEGADDLMAEQSSCLYVTVLTERQLAQATAAQIAGAVRAWRATFSRMLREALDARGGDAIDADALADHVFVTFEGAFVLCRSTGDPRHMRAQLTALRQLIAAVLDAPRARPAPGPPRSPLPDA